MLPKFSDLGFKNNLDKISFLMATAYLIFVGAWFIKQEKQKKILTKSTSQILPTQLATNPTLSKVNYPNLQENLELETSKIVNSNPPSIPVEQFQPISNTALENQAIVNVQVKETNQPPSTQPTNNPPPKVEKDRIPLPPPQLPPPSPLPMVSLTSHTPLPVPIPPPPKSSSQVKSKVPKLTSVPILESPVDKPVSPSNNHNSPLPPPPTETNSQLIAANINNKELYTLVGLIEIGEQSSALFKTNNLTEQVKPGEEIGISGWILDSIYDQKAIIQKQGTSKTLSLGAGF
jgi:hypothetical protein